ncbi:translocation/assembly module TamB domain-containing protein [Persephonella sp. KM09-Lau-8]|uniref:translocation/assembly module TamB domain-containing protein n=1 Tax=Persephonella sp. KM09-Lau-8 TaxID=1158345 RepID=UPI0004973A17|nr:translocation/assembly module TamB domain-containing protein [Persephonella sp. KM09-Lau-8]
MKKDIITILAVFAITISIFLLIGLTISFFWQKRAIIAKHYGIQLEDDCSLYFGELHCGFINAKSENKFDLSIKNLDAYFSLLNLIRRKPFVELYIKNADISAIIQKEGRKTQKIQKNPFKYIFFTLYFIKSDIDNLNLKILFSNKKSLKIKDFSLENSFNEFSTKKPFFVIFDGLTAKFEEISGSIEPESISIDNGVAYIDKGKFIFNGNFNYKGDYSFTGNYKGKKLVLQNLSLKGCNISFSVSQQGTKKAGNLNFSFDQITYQKNNIDNITGKLNYSGEEKLKGRFTLNISRLISGNLKISDISLSQNFDYLLKNHVFVSSGNGYIKSVKVKNFLIPEIKSVIKLSLKNKKIHITGNASSKNLKLSFDYKNSRIKISLNKTKLSDFYAFLGKQIPVESLITGNIQINLKNNLTTANFNLDSPNIYGIQYDKGSIYSEIKNKSLAGIYTLKLEKQDGFAFLNGSFNKNYLEGNFSFENLNLYQLTFGEKFKFGGILDGNGHYSGVLPDININLSGIAQEFYYDKIKLNQVSYLINYLPQEKKLDISFAKDNQLDGKLNIAFLPFQLELEIKANNADLRPINPFLTEKLPAVFSNIKPERISGNLLFSIIEKKWKLEYNFLEGLVFIPATESKLHFSSKGQLSPSDIKIQALIHGKNVKLKEYTVQSIKGLFHIKNKNGFLNLQAKGLSNFDKSILDANTRFNLKSQTIDGKASLILEKNGFQNNLKVTFAGNLKEIKGKLTEEGKQGKNVSIKTTVNFKLKTDKQFVNLNISSDKFAVMLPEDLNIHLMNLKGSLIVPVKNPKQFEGSLNLQKFAISQKYLYFFDSSAVNMSIKNGVITAQPISFAGIIKGKINRFIFKPLDSYMEINSEGTINRDFLSVFLKYVNTSGDLQYSFDFSGKLQNFVKNAKIKIYSKDLGVKTAYTIGILRVKDALISMDNGKIKISISGKSPNVSLGESFFNINGNGYLPKNIFRVNIDSQFLPVKYMNILSGNINTALKIKSFEKNRDTYYKITGKITATGRLKLEKEMQNQFKKEETPESQQKNFLKKILLDVGLESYIPVYIYGSWGKAYGEFKLKLTGTAAKPVINGNLSIIYGEIFFMRNKYNIDFANIKFINSEPYISARISTSIAETFIFIDVTGSLYQPKINFSSSPPKSKDEILSILLLRDTPSALENMPIFQTIGKIIYALLPFKSKNQRGLFNTGFEINILPQYSPSTGISASIFAKRSITRRIFVALSKPLGEIEEEKMVGWYSFGFKIKERSSFQYKWFETGNQEFDIVFNFPFDF